MMIAIPHAFIIYLVHPNNNMTYSSEGAPSLAQRDLGSQERSNETEAEEAKHAHKDAGIVADVKRDGLHRSR